VQVLGKPAKNVTALGRRTKGKAERVYPVIYSEAARVATDRRGRRRGTLNTRGTKENTGVLMVALPLEKTII